MIDGPKPELTKRHALFPTRCTRAILAVAAVAQAGGRLRATQFSDHRELETALQALTGAGILKGIRGPRGGYELGESGAAVGLGAIASVVLDISAAAEEASPPAPGLPATLAELVAAAEAAAFELLGNFTVADLIAQE
jgi:DNA-binding IscR family transcriptional regulator